MDALGNIWNRAAEEIAAEYRAGHPEDAAKDVIGQIARIRHACRASDGRAERSNNGDKASEDDRFSAVLLVEIVGSLQVAPAEEEGIFSLVECVSCGAADPVANLVADDGAKHDRGQ